MNIPRPPEWMAIQATFGLTFLGLTFSTLPLAQYLPVWGLCIWVASTMGLGWLAAYFVRRFLYKRSPE